MPMDHIPPPAEGIPTEVIQSGVIKEMIRALRKAKRFAETMRLEFNLDHDYLRAEYSLQVVQAIDSVLRKIPGYDASALPGARRPSLPELQQDGKDRG